ncbi:unnamed protein product [Merluccius merluccius]
MIAPAVSQSLMCILENQISHTMVFRQEHRVLGFGRHGCSTEPTSNMLRIQSADSTTFLDELFSLKSRYFLLELPLLTMADDIQLSLSQIIQSQVYQGSFDSNEPRHRLL